MPSLWAQPLPATFAAVMPVLDSLRFRDTVAEIVAKQWNNGVDHADALMVLVLMILDYGGPRPLSEVSDAGIAESFVPLAQESTSDEGYGPGGHPTVEQRDYSLAWEDPPDGS